MRSAPVNVSFAQPVSVSAALRAGMTRDQLRSRQLQTPFTGVRIGVAAPNDLVTRCLCLQEVLPSDAVFSGMTAAALHGWWLPFRPSFIDVTVSGSTPRARRAGVRCHQADIAVDQRTLCHGLAVTDAVRTLADLAAQYGLADLVVMADSALRRGDCDVQALLGFAEIAGGRRGIRTFRRMTKLSDNRSDSPMETLLRLSIVLPGLPPPTPQAILRDAAGGWLAQVDLLGADRKSVFEYDGAEHDNPKRHASDVTRWRILHEAGFLVYPYTARDLLLRPHQVPLDYAAALSLPEKSYDLDKWLREFKRSSFARRRWVTEASFSGLFGA